MFARAHSRPYPAWRSRLDGSLMEPRGDIPYGVAIAAGALLAYPVPPARVW
jgi:prepilin peptidase CpaA